MAYDWSTFNWREQANAAFVAEGKEPYYIDTTTPITPFGGFTGTTSNLVEPTGPVSYVNDMVNPLYGGQVATATRPSNGRILTGEALRKATTGGLSDQFKGARGSVSGTNAATVAVTQAGGVTAPNAANVATITALYQELFNRAPDAAGLAYWTGVMASGKSAAYVRTEMMKSAEYIAAHPVAAAPRSALVLLAVAAAAAYFLAKN